MLKTTFAVYRVWLHAE